MALRNCASCGKLFDAPSSSIRLCLQCEMDDQKQFDKVKEYLKEHATATVIEITKDTGVGRKQIYEWVRTGRLDVAGIHDLGIVCEGCGEPINTGRFAFSVPPACSRMPKDYWQVKSPRAVLEERRRRGFTWQIALSAVAETIKALAHCCR